MKPLTLLPTILMSLLLSSCLGGGLRRFSERQPIHVDRNVEGKTLFAEPEKEKPKEIFGKNKKLRVQPLDNESEETGSLTALDDERNFLFASYSPMNIGRYIDVKIVGTEQPAPQEASEKPKPQNGKEAPEKPNEEDELRQQLKRMFPDMQSPNGEKMPLLTKMRMEIVHREKNGDVIVNYFRESNALEDKNNHRITARIPIEVLREKDTFTTNDLVDVNYKEENAKEVMERNSLTWNNEYALRLSGFREAKSQEALRLAETKQELKNLSDKLQTKVNQLTKDKQFLAKERDQLLAEKKRLRENPSVANTNPNSDQTGESPATGAKPPVTQVPSEAPTALEKPIPPRVSNAAPQVPAPTPEVNKQTALKLNDVKGD